MFKDIEELMGAIDSFKSNMENTDELLAQLKKASQKIEQAEVRIQNDHQVLLTSFAEISKSEEISDLIQNTSRKLEQAEAALRADHQQLQNSLSRVSRTEDITSIHQAIAQRLQETEAALRANHQQMLDTVTELLKARENFTSFQSVNELEELTKAVEKFKTDLNGLEELLNLLKSTSQRMQKSDIIRKMDQERLINLCGVVSKKVNFAIYGIFILIILVIVLRLA